jgi:hypothetical protein
MPTSSAGASFSNLSANSPTFRLGGGRYNSAIIATFGGGNVGLQALGPDGSTWLPVFTALTTNGFATADLAPGQFRFGVTTATAVFASVYRLPS